MRLEFCRQIFDKYSKIKLCENPASGSRVVPCGRKGRHDEASNLYPQLCEGTFKLFADTIKNIRTVLHKSTALQVQEILLVEVISRAE